MDNENLTIKERREQKRLEKIERKMNEQNREKKSRLGLWLGIIILIAIVVVAMIKLAQKSPKDQARDTQVPISGSITEEDWVKGEKTATTTLVEYADFECPACAQFHPMTKELEKEFGSKVRFVYRHFPLSQHVNARFAARAAEAAGAQGKFWEMHDILYQNQGAWAGKGNAREIFSEYAKLLNLDEQKYDNDFESKVIGEKIDAQMKSGLRYGVISTPTFYLNDLKISPRNYEEFRQLIQNEIDQP